MSPPPNASQSKLAAIIALLLLVPAPSLGVYFAMMHEPTNTTAVGKTIYLVSKIWILIFPLIFLLLIERGRISLSPMRQGGLKTGLILGLITFTVILGSYFLFARSIIPAAAMRDEAIANGIGTPLNYLLFAGYATLINALLEEYVWRWFVFRRCEVLIGAKLAIIASALFFTFHHIVALKAQTTWTVTLLANLGIFIGACSWSWCYSRYRSVWPGYVAHVFADLAVYLIGWLIIFGSPGGSTGPNSTEQVTSPSKSVSTQLAK